MKQVQEEHDTRFERQAYKQTTLGSPLLTSPCAILVRTMLSIQRDGRVLTQKQAVQGYHINIGISYAPEPLSSVPNPDLPPKPTVRPGVNAILLRLISLIAFGYGTHQRPSQSPNRQLCTTRVARTSSVLLIHATLSYDRKPFLVHLTPSLATSLKPASQYQRRCGRDFKPQSSDQPR